MSRILLLLLSVACAAVFAFALVKFQSTFSPRMMLVVFFLMPILAVFALVAALRFSPAIRAKLLLALGACVMTLYVLEFFLPVLGRQAAALRSDESSPAGAADVREMLQVVLDLREEGTAVVPSVEPKGFLWTQPDGTVKSGLADSGEELLPLGGIAHRLTVLCNEGGDWITHTSDRFGMNSPDANWDRRPLGLAVVGDSFANGWCCEAGDHFVTLLRETYPDAVNLGMSGNGPLLILASLLEYLPEAQPEIVLWFHYEGNDFLDLRKERNSSLLARYLEGDVTQGLRERQDVVDREIDTYVERGIEHWRQKSSREFRVKSFLTLFRVRHVLGLKYHPAPEYALFSRVLEKANRSVESWGGKLYFVYLPLSDRYRSALVTSGTYGAIHERVKSEIDRLGIEFIDVHETFRMENDPLSMYIAIRAGNRIGEYGHFSKQGNRRVAETVLGALPTEEDR
jgi:hypothetical protein